MHTKVLVRCIVILAIIVAGLAWLNHTRMSELDPAALVVKVGGEKVATITLDEIMALGSEEFSHILRSSGRDPVENTYVGIPLFQVLETAQPGILDGRSQVSVVAVDGYAVAFSVEEVRQPNHIYLVWQKDGEDLGTKEEGGSGPLLIIPRLDEFGQRWCKFAVEADIR